MAKFIIDASGKLVQKPQFIGHSSINAYKKPVSALDKLDRIMHGEPPSVCICRSKGGIGDVLMTLPTVKAIKNRYKGKVGYATNIDYLNGALYKVVQGNPYIDEVFDYKKLNYQDWDTVIDLTCPCVAHEVPGAIPINRIDLFARHAGLGIPLEDPSIDYAITEKEMKWAKEWIEYRRLNGKKLVIVQANSSTTRRDLPTPVLLKSIAGILNNFNMYGIVVLHSDSDTSINWKLDRTEIMRDYDVRHIAAIMNYCDLVMCPDSALLHLASALEKKTITFFGPTDPRARVNYHPQAIAIWGAYNLHCKVCWYDQKCRSQFACWKNITPEMVLDAADHILNNKTIISKPWLVNFSKKEKDAPFEIL